MKKLLYITVNSKPEDLSASRTVGRAFVNKFLEKHQYFEKRNTMIKKEAIDQLNEKEQQEVHKIVELSDQFKNADLYVIAPPTWSLSFPAPLKEYIDCIVMDGKTIDLSDDKLETLLNNEIVKMVCIQYCRPKLLHY